ncbi:hypothetical protein H1P_510036 [Hyella patelloides LEGE 07179]|uniref:Uncharacterized protein n=1 Tax=Hyella patelloides LEGE 07179 TaxID=945734 RepID=A0A563W087_9CYAN|nr:hypothetical protein [Hyella patelloides]VEP16933.1 hypothetical protein H1P_510036 [Hyella patelloides LEGE 07179]
MSYQNLSSSNESSSSKATSNSTLGDECILMSFTLDKHQLHHSLEEEKRTDRDLSTGDYFFLSVCITFLVMVSTSWMQTSLIYDEVEQVIQEVRSQKSEVRNK